jgi:hypothetical protein
VSYLKLFVDDLRNPPTQDWMVARSYGEAVAVLSTAPVVEISLDHDLGEDKSGYDVAKWMIESDTWPRIIRVHTANPVGRDNIFQLLEHYAPKGTRIVVL